MEGKREKQCPYRVSSLFHRCEFIALFGLNLLISVQISKRKSSDLCCNSVMLMSLFGWQRGTFVLNKTADEENQFEEISYFLFIPTDIRCHLLLLALWATYTLTHTQMRGHICTSTYTETHTVWPTVEQRNHTCGLLSCLPGQ